MSGGKKILVTGGSGFIGTNLIKELRSRNHEVIACDLLNHELPGYIRCDVRNHRHIERVFEKFGPFDYVYHLAAEYGRWNFCMIFFSSAEVYGDYEGEMTEDVMIGNPIKDTYQMNDYAISKWAGELMCLNSANMFGTKTVRVRPVNCYGPHEEYNPYRGFIPKFIYHALHKKPYTVYEGHKRIIDYVEDTCNTFANIVDNFIPGEVYNVGGRREWEHDIKDYSDMILSACNRDDSIVTYKKAEVNTTKVKHMDFSKAERDLKHNPQITPEEGIKRTVDWMKWYYRFDEKVKILVKTLA